MIMTHVPIYIDANTRYINIAGILLFLLFGCHKGHTLQPAELGTDGNWMSISLQVVSDQGTASWGFSAGEKPHQYVAVVLCAQLLEVAGRQVVRGYRLESLTKSWTGQNPTITCPPIPSCIDHLKAVVGIYNCQENLRERSLCRRGILSLQGLWGQCVSFLVLHGTEGNSTFPQNPQQLISTLVWWAQPWTPPQGSPKWLYIHILHNRGDRWDPNPEAVGDCPLGVSSSQVSAAQKMVFEVFSGCYIINIVA